MLLSFFFFFNDTATTEIYTLSLHDALPIFFPSGIFNGQVEVMPVNMNATVETAIPLAELQAIMDDFVSSVQNGEFVIPFPGTPAEDAAARSEEHTSELQSRTNLVCRLLLEKKKNKHTHTQKKKTQQKNKKKK